MERARSLAAWSPDAAHCIGEMNPLEEIKIFAKKEERNGLSDVLGLIEVFG